MKQRDIWKAKAKKLALDNPMDVSEDQVTAWGEFKKLRNKINNLKGLEEVIYKKEKIQENVQDSAKVWKLTKIFMNWKSTGTPTQLEESGNLITSAKRISQVMNHFFIDKVRTLRQSMAKVAINLTPCFNIMKGKTCKLNLSHITVDKVKKLLSKLSNSRSTSIDELDNYSVKIAAPIIAAPLHHIITLSILQQRFPRKWKYAKVLPLH